MEYGSFTRAAEILHYSQSGVSRMIGDLEKDWNMVLLERGKGGVRLTSNGLHMLPYAKELVADYEKMQMQVNALNGMQSGLIRIGTFSSIATHWLPNIIREFQKDYPHIEYELLLGSYTELEKWITEGRVDCSFVRLPTLGKFDTIFLEEDRLMAVLPENHPLAGLEKFPVAALCDAPFMMLEKDARADAAEIFERCGLSPVGALYHVGRLRHYVHGGKRTGCQHLAGTDFTACAVPHLCPGTGCSRIPPDRTRTSGSGKRITRRQVLSGVSQIPA